MRPSFLVLGALLSCACASPSRTSATSDTGVTPTIDVGVETSAPSACTHDRTAVDRPDDVEGYQVRAWYVLPSDGKDEERDRDGSIEKSVLAWNGWLATRAKGSKLRIDTCEGELDIGFLRLSKTDAEIAARGAFVREAIQEGIGPQDPKKMLAVYYGGGSTHSCGGAAWPPALIGRVVAMYLHGTPPGAPACDTNELGRTPEDPGYFQLGMLHEIFHALGGVATCAPHHFEGGHVSDDPRDLMYRGSKPWAPSILDVGSDDYFGNAATGSSCLDLSKSAFFDPLPEGAKPPPGW